jgi:hypothetical protein
VEHVFHRVREYREVKRKLMTAFPGTETARGNTVRLIYSNIYYLLLQVGLYPVAVVLQ